MQRRYNLAHFILAGVVALVLTPLMVCVDAQAQIAFASNRDGNYEIYVMDADGKNQHRLTNHPHSDWEPSWSPDGKRIAFSSDRDGHVHAILGLPTYEIYVMDDDGGNQQNLTNNPHYDRSPSWSPDGKRIAFMSEREEPPLSFDIYVMDADGSNPQRLTENPKDDRDPSWSPDGKRIVFSSEREGHFIGEIGITSEIHVMDADGQNEQRLTENRRYDWFPSWSPDGKRIAFTSLRNGNWQIYVMDADGNNPRNLTNNDFNDWDPSWSPDGKRIAFVSYRDGSVINGRPTSEIYMMDNDGDNPQNLTNNPHDDCCPSEPVLKRKTLLKS